MRPYILNHRKGGSIGILLRFFTILPLWLLFLFIFASFTLLTTYVERIPPVPDLRSNRMGRFTEIRSRDNVRIGGLLRGKHPWKIYSEIPPLVVMAFISAEDDNFFAHNGADLPGILRAAWINLRRGSVRQGASTITQQVARHFLSKEKTFDRKLLEILLARRMEATYSKTDILEAYLNQIYLGAGAYGVSAAAENYFGLSLDQLDLSQAALIAGIATAPSKLNPWRNPKGALKRRSYVLTRMFDLGLIDETTLETAQEATLELQDFSESLDSAPEIVTETARRMRDHFGTKWFAKNVVITTTVDRFTQHHTRRSLIQGTDELGMKQGYTGPLAQLSPQEARTFMINSTLLYGHNPVTPGRVMLGLIRKVTPENITLAIGDQIYTLAADEARWAAPYDENSRKNNGTLEIFDDAFQTGDVILVRGVQEPDLDEERKKIKIPGLELVQFTPVQGAVVIMDMATDAVMALIGGVDFDRNEFNRITQSCRQPGSVFKPIVYSLAMNGMHYTPATLLPDTPLRLRDDEGNLIWKPRNPDRDYKGTLTLFDSLARSRNLTTIRLAQSLGYNRIVNWARKLGLTGDLSPTPSISLGAYCVNPMEITRIYGTFAQSGLPVKDVLIESVVTLRGELKLDQGLFFAPYATTGQRLSRFLSEMGSTDRHMISDRTAYLTDFLLKMVVKRGTGSPAKSLKIPVAGKTGTTNAYDAWFIGYSDRFLATVWVGADKNDRPLGKGVSGGKTALPIFIKALTPLIDSQDQINSHLSSDDRLQEKVPDGIVFAQIEPHSGKLAVPGTASLSVPFKKGTQPTEEAQSSGVRQIHEIDKVDHKF